MVKIKKCLEISKDSLETLEKALDILNEVVDKLGNVYLDDTFNYPDVLDDINKALDDIF